MSHTRKLCCNAALYTTAVKEDDNMSAFQARSQNGVHGIQDSQHLSAVILLNSPASGTWEFKEYLRLRQAYHATQKGASSNTLPRCYFICADGAYQALQKYVAMAYKSATDNSSDKLDGKKGWTEKVVEPLCDAIIGDMDSFSNFYGIVNEVGDKVARADCEYEYYGWYDTVEAITDEVINRIRTNLAQRGHAGESQAVGQYRKPVLLPITCQMTNDFEKCLLLLQRLQTTMRSGTEDKVDGVQLVSDKSEAMHSSDQALLALESAYERAIENTQCLINEMWSDDKRQAAYEEQMRCSRLLGECLDQQRLNMNREGCCSASLKTVVLPNVAVLGALGGRVDHEMGVMSCVVKFATQFHVMVTNEENVLFACWPNGITQWLTGRSLHPVGKAPNQDSDGKTCGVIPFGTVREMETTGLQWNIVNGRPNRCDKITQTQGIRFSFDNVISTSNMTTEDVVTVDLRLLQSNMDRTENITPNPPTLITCMRQHVAPS